MLNHVGGLESQIIHPAYTQKTLDQSSIEEPT